MIEELSGRSRLLLQKGAAYQNNIGRLTSATAGYYNFPGFGVTYNFITYPKIIDEYSYKYKFYHTKMKRITHCKIYSPFSHFKGNGFEFKRIVGPKKNDIVTVSLFHDNKKIKTVFIHNFKEINYYTNVIYRDRNNLFIKESLTGKWYGTSENLFFKATNYASKTKTPFNVSNFWGDFYEVQKKGTGYVMGTLVEWRKLVSKGESHLMPFIVRRTSRGRIDVGITRNIIFLTSPRELRTQTKEVILKNCKYLGRFILTEADTKQLQAMYPGFCFTFLEKFVRPPQIRDIDFFGRAYMHLIPRTEYNKIPLTEYPLMNFFIQNNRYTKWFKNDYNVFCSPLVVDILESLTKCQELFDYNVLPIKKTVKDIGDLNN